jgi:hypothetical protein
MARRWDSKPRRKSTQAILRELRKVGKPVFQPGIFNETGEGSSEEHPWLIYCELPTGLTIVVTGFQRLGGRNTCELYRTDDYRQMLADSGGQFRRLWVRPSAVGYSRAFAPLLRKGLTRERETKVNVHGLADKLLVKVWPKGRRKVCSWQWSGCYWETTNRDAVAMAECVLNGADPYHIFDFLADNSADFEATMGFAMREGSDIAESRRRNEEYLKRCADEADILYAPELAEATS